MTAENDQDARNNQLSAPWLLPYLETAPIQVLIPKTGKKLLGFLLDESEDGVAVQLRRTQCLVEGYKVQVARNGGLEDAIVKNVEDLSLSTRVGLEWV